MVSISPLEAQQANSHSQSLSSCLISQHKTQVQLWLTGASFPSLGLIKQKPIWVISLASPSGVGVGFYIDNITGWGYGVLQQLGAGYISSLSKGDVGGGDG